MHPFRTLRECYYKTYWYLRLVGYKIDPAKGKIYATDHWRFIVLDGTYELPTDAPYKKYRLHLRTNPMSGRIVGVDIG